MSALNDFINSLSDEDKKILDDIKESAPSEFTGSSEELTRETIKRILDLHIASDKIPESAREQILSEFTKSEE